MSVLEALIGWLAAAGCLSCGIEGTALCEECSGAVIKNFGERCWRCDRLSSGSKTCGSCYSAGPLSHVYISTVYDDKARQLVQIYKFGHLRAAARPLARLMSKTLKDIALDRNDYLIVPLPTATARVRERGFGHSELLAKTIAAELGIEYCFALRRLGQSRQLGARREQRLVQLESSFALRYPRRIKGRKILLIDDVLTTGGSLISAAKVLKSGGARQVDALVFAKKL